MMIATLKASICIVLLFGFWNPVAFAADQAIVAKRTIYPGQMIEATNLQAVILTKTPKIRYRFVTQFHEIVGLMARRTILQGRFIAMSSASPAPVVKPGGKIRVQFKSRGLAIELLGVALTAGSYGDEISLRNPASGEIINGRIREDGIVVVGQL